LRTPSHRQKSEANEADPYGKLVMLVQSLGHERIFFSSRAQLAEKKSRQTASKINWMLTDEAVRLGDQATGRHQSV
jgi:hypothetical protein